MVRAAAAVVVATGWGAVGHTAVAQQASFPAPGSAPASTFRVPAIPSAPAITTNGVVVEDVIARINDRVITRTEYERSQQQLVEEAKQENWPASELDQKEHDLLRDMIDQQLLLSKGKELGITGDTETMRQLDEIRKRANLPDMESLEKEAAKQGVSYEDFKQNIRNQVITQQVVREDVGRHINMSPSQEQAYYASHIKEFEQPEQVHLSEILVPTPDNATDAQIAAAQAKADELEGKLKAGTSFADLAKSSSGGPTASAGGDLGDFKRGMLGSDVLENATFPLPAGGVTAPIRTRQGFVILRVDSHQAAGTPPLQQIEPQVQEAIYMSQLQPALRTYLTQAREDAYVKTAPGFDDAGAGDADSKMKFTTYAPPPLKKKVVKKQKAEEQKAVKAETQLATAREKLAEKQQAKAAAASARNGTAPGAQTVAAVQKPKKIRREKVRYGQAPRNALPNGSTEVVAAVPSLGASAEGNASAALGQAPGAAMASPGQSIASISTGAGNGGDVSDNPLAPQTGPERKTRFSARQTESDEKKAQVKLARAEVKTSKRPEPATPQDTADEKVQSAPLGFANDTPKATKKRHKRAKDEPKERLQEKPKPAETPNEVAPTVNPTLGASATGAGAGAAGANTSDRTTLPPSTPTTPGGTPAGQPIPAVTSAQPGAPATTVPPPQ